MLENPEGFEIWMRQLRALIAEKYPGYSEDEDAWRQFYDDAYSPADALAEDMSYGEGS